MIYQNPILRGFHPDPSICRVGEDYYLVVSSFEYFPGIPIYHSRDLVNWRQIGNCLQSSEEFPLLPVGDSGGVWAPTIRWDHGLFYVTATLEGYGNFIVTAQDPAGEWSSPVWVKEVGGIDPSLYFEDGHAYYCTNDRLDDSGEMISMQEIDPKTGAIIGKRHMLWRGTGRHFMEAPHVYHIDGWYYLMVAEGGTFFTHCVTIARSRSMWGPYESCPHNPILTSIGDASWQIQCSGHADLIEDAHGQWWMMHLGIRLARRTMTHLGRETFLAPVRWENGWPIGGREGMAMLCNEGPEAAVQEPLRPFIANMKVKDWEPEWLFLRRLDRARYDRSGDALVLMPSPQTLDDPVPTFAALRPLDFDCITETTFVFVPSCAADEAGLAVRLDHQFYITCTIRNQFDARMLTLTIHAEQIHHIVASVAVPDGPLTLRMTASHEAYRFDYAVDGNQAYLGQASTRFVATELSGRCFTGTVIGLYTTGAADTAAKMIVHDFRMLPAE